MTCPPIVFDINEIEKFAKQGYSFNKMARKVKPNCATQTLRGFVKRNLSPEIYEQIVTNGKTQQKIAGHVSSSRINQQYEKEMV